MRYITISKLFIFLSIAHVPLIYYQDQSIGMFDFFIGLYALYLIIKNTNNLVKINIVFGLYSLYMSYALINLITIGSTSIQSVALFLKFIQFAFIYIVATDIFKKINKEEIPILLAISVITIAIYGIWHLYVTGTWYRLGLPGMIGVSSNPGGFVTGLNTVVLFYIIISGKYKKHKLLLNILIIVSIYCLYMTYSRTNQLSTLVTLFVLIFVEIKKVNKKYLQVIIIISILVGIIFYLSTSNLNTKSAENIFTSIITPEESILNDNSFVARTIAWQVIFESYTSSIYSMIFGLGFGNVGAIDSLYLRILYNIGIIGLLLIIIFTSPLFFNGSRTPLLKYLAIYILINGIASETLYSSYRSVQYFLTLLALIKITTKQDDKYFHHRSYLQ